MNESCTVEIEIIQTYNIFTAFEQVATNVIADESRRPCNEYGDIIISNFAR